MANPDFEMKHKLSYFELPNSIKRITELTKYKGESEIILQCTQLSGYENPKYESAQVKKQVLNDWINFFINNPNSFTKIIFTSNTTQELLNAVCCQGNLKYLQIKSGNYSDISQIEKLSQLEYLSITSGSSIEDILPLSKLDSLIALKLWYFPKITDYSCLKHLKHLEALDIEGDGNSPRKTTIESLEFVTKLQNLRRFTWETINVKDKDYTPILSLSNLEALNIELPKNLESLYEQFKNLPKLKYGLVFKHL